MKLKTTHPNTHIQVAQKTEGGSNLLGFFALLYRVDMRNKREFKALATGVGQGMVPCGADKMPVIANKSDKGVL